MPKLCPDDLMPNALVGILSKSCPDVWHTLYWLYLAKPIYRAIGLDHEAVTPHSQGCESQRRRGKAIGGRISALFLSLQRLGRPLVSDSTHKDNVPRQTKSGQGPNLRGYDRFLELSFASVLLR